VQIDHADNAAGPGNQQSEVSSMTPSQKAASEPIPADKIGAAKTIL
jgi:hypothetical protein